MKKIFFVALLLPAIASAQVTDLFTGFDYIQSILLKLLDFMMPLATAFFFWNTIKYIKAAGEGNTKALDEGRKAMVFTGVALFLMVGIWSVVSYVISSVGIDTSGQPILNSPTMPKASDIK